MSNNYTFKVASEDWEFEQIHRLNYRTFVEEIPQHQSNTGNRLVDKFHEENTYVICLQDNQLVGMSAIRGTRPFSLDKKLKNLDSYLPEAHSPCEIRLLAIDEHHRGGQILRGLMELLIHYYDYHKHDLVIISAAMSQLRLYQHMGFIAFGPLVGTQEALFQPMYLNPENVEKLKDRIKMTWYYPTVTSSQVEKRVNLLPGPVGIRQEIRQALTEDPVSHRSYCFIEDFQEVKRLLCQLVNSKKVEILMGSGTLANDAVAAQLSLFREHGLILSNGEFGERLIDHATRFGLSFTTFKVDWGTSFSRNDIEYAIEQSFKIIWLWAVHCESSTGFLNDITMIKEICQKRGIKLCVDCISSIGVVPLDLHDVYLASGVSGKGLGSFPGLSMVFYNHEILPEPTILPRYIDIGLYAAYKGIPFTISSNQIYALKEALQPFKSTKPYDEVSVLYSWLRDKLGELDVKIISPDEANSPAIVTIVLPEEVSSERIGQQLEDAGYLLSYRSEYLLKRNWIQLCLMGECSRDKISPLFSLLKELIKSESNKRDIAEYLVPH